MLISDHVIVFRMRQVLKSPSICSRTNRAFHVGCLVGRSEMDFLPKFRSEFEKELFKFNPSIKLEASIKVCCSYFV